MKFILKGHSCIKIDTLIFFSMTTSIELRSREDIDVESTSSVLSAASYISYQDVTLIWIDQNANETADCLHTQDCLRDVVDDVKIFDGAEESIRYIQWIAPEKNIFVIISGLLAELVLSQTHDVVQLEAIYIFCLDEEKYIPLMNRYRKIRGIFVDKFKLFYQMAEDVLKFDEKLFSMHIFARKHENGIETSMRDYVIDDKITLNWIELFCLILVYLPLDRKAKQDMIKQCRMYYHGNDAEQKKIDRFAEQNCTEDVIIHWYTRDSFVYRLINKALRTLNIDIIFKFRFFIIELYRQLKSYHTNYIESLLFTPTHTEKIRTVYRGQLISTDELEKLKNSVGNTISSTSFLSTTEDEIMARGFIAGAPSSNSALFEINIPDSYYDQISDSLSYNAPFFKVNSVSQFRGESEIIFSMGTNFRIISIEQDSVWHIRLELDEHNNLLTKQFRYVLKQQRYTHDWQTRSSVDKRILLLIDKLPKPYRAVLNLYIQEGVFVDDNQRLTTATESINCYRKGFDLLCNYLPDHFYLLRVIMCLGIGIFYTNLCDTAMSIRFGTLALDIATKYLLTDSECLLVCYNYLAVIYKLDNRLETVLCIYNDMFHIARKNKNTSALLEVCDKTCELRRKLGLHKFGPCCNEKILKCLVRLIPNKIISLPDHNHSLYLNYKTLIKFLQRLMKHKWPRKRKRSLEIFLAKKWTTLVLFTKYIDKLKFMLYFELNNLPRFQLSLQSLLTQAMADYQPRQTYENCFQQLIQDMKRIYTVAPICSANINIDTKILQKFQQSLDAYERSLHQMRTTYSLTELANRYENIALRETFKKIRHIILDFIRFNRRILSSNRQHRIFRPRHRSSPIYLSRKIK